MLNLVGIAEMLWGMNITIFKVLIAPTIFVVELKQFTFRIQQNLKTYRQQLL
jgi:hypothetical protein